MDVGKTGKNVLMTIYFSFFVYVEGKLTVTVNHIKTSDV